MAQEAREGYSRISDHPVRGEVSGAARGEDSGHRDRRDGQEHPGRAEQDRATHDAKGHDDRMELHGAADADAVAATRSQIVDRDKADSAVSEFTVAADGVTTIDTSHLDFEGSVEAVLQVVEAARA